MFYRLQQSLNHFCIALLHLIKNGFACHKKIEAITKSETIANARAKTPSTENICGRWNLQGEAKVANHRG